MLHMLMQHQGELRAASQLVQKVDGDHGDAIRAESRPSVTIDVKKYQDMIDHPDLTAEQKHQIVLALWSMVIMFVDLGFTPEDCRRD